MSSSPMDHFLGWRTTLCVPHAHFDPSAQDQRYGSVTPLVDNQVGGLQSGAIGSSQDLDAQNEHERNISPRIDNSNRCRIPTSQDLMDLAGELQSRYVLPVGNHTSSNA
ncbi:hypothetical protein V6N12_036821 [Hibiscus sabdariffa]|uniref:Uncharacterized protein n=1 Tax=Hibiscus sabdariffa TaxID=183260 RepID=A0ABR2BWH1_9ROSI